MLRFCDWTLYNQTREISRMIKKRTKKHDYLDLLLKQVIIRNAQWQALIRYIFMP